MVLVFGFLSSVGWLVGGFVWKLWLSESGESGEGGDGLRDVWIHSRSWRDVRWVRHGAGSARGCARLRGGSALRRDRMTGRPPPPKITHTFKEKRGPSTSQTDPNTDTALQRTALPKILSRYRPRSGDGTRRPRKVERADSQVHSHYESFVDAEADAGASLRFPHPISVGDASRLQRGSQGHLR